MKGWTRWEWGFIVGFVALILVIVLPAVLS